MHELFWRYSHIERYRNDVKMTWTILNFNGDVGFNLSDCQRLYTHFSFHAKIHFCSSIVSYPSVEREAGLKGARYAFASFLFYLVTTSFARGFYNRSASRRSTPCISHDALAGSLIYRRTKVKTFIRRCSWCRAWHALPRKKIPGYVFNRVCAAAGRDFTRCLDNAQYTFGASQV